MPKSAAVEGATLTLTYDEDLQTASPAPASGKGPVYLAVVSGPGAQRSIDDGAPDGGGGAGAAPSPSPLIPRRNTTRP